MHYQEWIKIECNLYDEIELFVNDPTDTATVHLSFKEAVKLKKDLENCLNELIDRM